MNLQQAVSSLRGQLTHDQRRRLKGILKPRHFRELQDFAYRAAFGSNLDALATINEVDKITSHKYTQHYAKYLGRYRAKPVRLLEIGIGGYDNPTEGGASLRMWRSYFPKGRIYGIDIHDKSVLDERRIKTFRGSQADTEFLCAVVEATGGIDVVIDDGSHRCDHIITTFEFLFPRMNERGIYAIEDVQTSYWESYGGNDRDPDRPETTMGYFKELIHGLNHEERPSQTDEPNYFDRNILGVSFFHNLIVIEKGPNTEGGSH
jgi:hypothetical protein